MTARRSDRASDRGAALAFVILLLVALMLLGHGVLVSSLGELAASRAVVRQMRSRAAAEAAVHLVLRGWGATSLDGVPVGAVLDLGARPLGEAHASGVLRRLSAESWAVEGSGWTVGRARARVAALSWALDPVTRVAALPGAVTVASGAPLTVSGSVDAASPAAVVPPLAHADCAPWLPDLVLRYASAPLAATAALSDTAGAPRLGRVDFDDLLTAGFVAVSGAGTPSPVERLGVCAVDEPWGWGDPEQPWRPCGAHLPGRVSSGDLSVVGGVGQGFLAVDGDLTLTAGARFYGLLLVRGSLRVEGGASLDGLAWASGGAHVGPLGSVRASACWATRALAAQRARLGRLEVLHRVGAVGPR